MQVYAIFIDDFIQDWDWTFSSGDYEDIYSMFTCGITDTVMKVMVF